MRPIHSTSLGALYHGDCVEGMRALPPESVDLVFADPPFNLGKDYGRAVRDDLAEREYLAWSARWLDAAVPTLREGGALYLWNLPKWNLHLGGMLASRGLTFRHWIAVDIKYSLPIRGRLYPSHYSLLYFTKGLPGTFVRPRVPVPTCRHCGKDVKDYGGHRGKLHPEGLNLSDVWTDIPPVRHRTTKTRHANELSPKLLRRVLETSTVEGQLVLDPFCGSGTTCVVAESMGRRWIGIELGDCRPIVDRLGGRSVRIVKDRGDVGKGLRRAGVGPRVV